MGNAISTKPTTWLGKVRAKWQCWRGIQAPDRMRVRKDGLFYTGKCETCGKPIRKRNGRPWKPYKT